MMPISANPRKASIELIRFLGVIVCVCVMI
jgi:hypothetical protein